MSKKGKNRGRLAAKFGCNSLATESKINKAAWAMAREASRGGGPVGDGSLRGRGSQRIYIPTESTIPGEGR